MFSSQHQKKKNFRYIYNNLLLLVHCCAWIRSKSHGHQNIAPKFESPSWPFKFYNCSPTTNSFIYPLERPVRRWPMADGGWTEPNTTWKKWTKHRNGSIKWIEQIFSLSTQRHFIQIKMVLKLAVVLDCPPEQWTQKEHNLAILGLKPSLLLCKRWIELNLLRIGFDIYKWQNPEMGHCNIYCFLRFASGSSF